MPNQPQQEQSFWGTILDNLPRVLLIYFGVNFVTSNFLQPKQTVDTPGTSSTPTAYKALWQLGTEIDFYFYIDNSEYYSPQSQLIFEKHGLIFGDFSNTVSKEVSIPCTEVTIR